MGERAAITRAVTALVEAVLAAQNTAPCPRCGHVPGTPATPAPEAPAGEADPLLSRKELAERYQVPVATVEQWAHKGYGPRGFPVGRYVRYRLRDVLEWEQRQHEAPPRSGYNHG